MMNAGHQILSHSGDLALEAWAPDKGECIAHAMEALVESFADVRQALPREHVKFTAKEPSDEGLLVAVLDDVIYQLDVHGLLPVDISVDTQPAQPEGISAGTLPASADVRFAAVRADEAELTGAVPKAVSPHELRFGRDGELWRCHVTVDT
jgi:SHS2 domain-containing protein